CRPLPSGLNRTFLLCAFFGNSGPSSIPQNRISLPSSPNSSSYFRVPIRPKWERGTQLSSPYNALLTFTCGLDSEKPLNSVSRISDFPSPSPSSRYNTYGASVTMIPFFHRNTPLGNIKSSA